MVRFMTSIRVTPAQVVRASLAPTLFLFVVPAFGFWFAGYATRSQDAAFVEAIEQRMQREVMTNAERAEANAFYRAHPPSRLCVESSNVGRDFQTRASEICRDHLQFRVARQASGLAIALGVLAVVVAVLGALVAHRSRAAEYRSFVVSFELLRAIGAVVSVIQAGLVVWLAFWVTAILWNVYYLKILLVAGLLALGAVYALLRALFAKLPRTIPVQGLLVPKEKAKALFERLEHICETLGTRPPDHLIAGIDDNFFVCEGEVECPNGFAEGRVLYVSLSLLRILSKREAEAVLVHEMAHFSGGDVEHSTKLAPALMRFGVFVHSLEQSPLSIPVARFLIAFRSLFELAFGRSHRERELVADATAARLVSREDVARALVRIGAYASFGSRVETALFENDDVHASLSIAQRIDHGFADYLRTPKLAFDLVGASTPHPFDSHPPLLERLANVGVEVPEAELVSLIEAAAEDRHYDSIEGADALEASQWEAYEKHFRANHELALAYRYAPATPKERALVEAHFPALELAGKDGTPYVKLDCVELWCRDWAAPIRWTEITKAHFDDRWTKKPLDLTLASDGMLTKKHSVKTYELEARAEQFLEAFNRYWTRARAAEAYRKERGGV